MSPSEPGVGKPERRARRSKRVPRTEESPWDMMEITRLWVTDGDMVAMSRFLAAYEDMSYHAQLCTVWFS